MTGKTLNDIFAFKEVLTHDNATTVLEVEDVKLLVPML
jgi:hypothetical protein